MRQASSKPMVSEGSHLLLDYRRQPSGILWPQAQDKTFGLAADEMQKIFRNSSIETTGAALLSGQQSIVHRAPWLDWN